MYGVGAAIRVGGPEIISAGARVSEVDARVAIVACEFVGPGHGRDERGKRFVVDVFKFSHVAAAQVIAGDIVLDVDALSFEREQFELCVAHDRIELAAASTTDSSESCSSARRSWPKRRSATSRRCISMRMRSS